MRDRIVALCLASAVVLTLPTFVRAVTPSDAASNGPVHACLNGTHAEGNWWTVGPFSCPAHAGFPAPWYGDLIVDPSGNVTNPVATTSTTAATTTTGATTTTSSTTTTTTTTTTQPAGTCSGVAMLAGQADINAAPANTTFCLTGTHNWSLTPKAGDTFRGPATLDGANTTTHAFTATVPNVTLDRLTIQHYSNGNGTQDGAIHVADDSATKAAAAGWDLVNLDVGFNSASGSGTGNAWTIAGGRFHDNRQEGIGGSMGNNVTVNGVEIDHNDFTNTAYTTRNWSCGDEAGGIKWVTNNMTVENSNVHDNACKGIWADLSAEHSIIQNNRVVNNWDEGVFIEISSSATITGNTVTGNGLRNYNSGGTCSHSFGWAGGITISTSGQTKAAGAGTITVSGNTLSGNCQGISEVDQSRNESPCPCELENVTVTNNSISGGVTGAWADDGDSLATHKLTWTNNTLSGGATVCGVTC